jgi:hypothetical protein
VQWSSDIFDPLFSQILEREGYTVADLIANGARDADSAGFGERFQSRSDIDTVAENIAVLDDHIAEIDSNAELEALLIGYIGIALGHALLDFNGAARGLHRAGKSN